MVADFPDQHIERQTVVMTSEMHRPTVIIVLILVVCGAVTFAVLSTRRNDKPPQTWIDAKSKQPLELIDEKTFEMIVKPFGEWEALGRKGLKYKNPATGEYTMCAPVKCASCGEKVGRPDIRSNLYEMGESERNEYLKQFKCPKCGKHVFEVH